MSEHLSFSSRLPKAVEYNLSCIPYDPLDLIGFCLSVPLFLWILADAYRCSLSCRNQSLMFSVKFEPQSQILDLDTSVQHVGCVYLQAL